MQGKTILEIGGLQGQQTPLINVIINSQSNPSSDVDTEIINKIIDITPSVDNLPLEHTDTK